MDKLASSIVKKLFNYQSTMKKFTLLSLAIAMVMALSVSCKKKCSIAEDDSYSGDIVWVDQDANEIPVIYPTSGYMTDNMNGQFHITESHAYSELFEVSFNGGVTKAPINYTQYNLLCYPIQVACDVAVSRTVTIDHANSIVTYSIGVDDCKDGCDELRTLENYILVPAFPESYTVIYDVP